MSGPSTFFGVGTCWNLNHELKRCWQFLAHKKKNKVSRSSADWPIISSIEAAEHVQLGLGLCDCDVQRRGTRGGGGLPMAVPLRWMIFSQSRHTSRYRTPSGQSHARFVGYMLSYMLLIMLNHVISRWRSDWYSRGLSSRGSHAHRGQQRSLARGGVRDAGSCGFLRRILSLLVPPQQTNIYRCGKPMKTPYL